MCFSVNVNLVKEELESRYGATLIDPDKYRPSFYLHAFSIPEMPVICSDDPAKIKLFRWGLIPSSSGSMEEAERIRNKTFNARAEGLSDKRSFSLSYRSKRCIIPIRGFFEWQHKGKEKIPWYIYKSDDSIISLAGLYDTWIFDKTGEVFNTFTIVTTEANELLSEIHNSAKRMPAILDIVQEKRWLDLSASENELTDILRPSSMILNAHTVGPLVNDRNADRNTPDVIKPYRKPLQTTLF
ncbi:MAG TPA: SOS response-associated peptidase [Bacteroidales bacterium]|nr:SOS response-associated peptidase [Bacteroidales bacterium]